MSSPAYGQSNKDNDGATGRLIRIICHRVSPVALKLKLNTYSKVVLLSLHIHPFVVIASCNATLSIGQLGPFAPIVNRCCSCSSTTFNWNWSFARDPRWDPPPSTNSPQLRFMITSGVKLRWWHLCPRNHLQSVIINQLGCAKVQLIYLSPKTSLFFLYSWCLSLHPGRIFVIHSFDSIQLLSCQQMCTFAIIYVHSSINSSLLGFSRHGSATLANWFAVKMLFIKADELKSSN